MLAGVGLAERDEPDSNILRIVENYQLGAMGGRRSRVATAPFGQVVSAGVRWGLGRALDRCCFSRVQVS